jgi:hypothetical protein
MVVILKLQRWQIYQGMGNTDKLEINTEPP